ncbi:serpentine type 7TM GPCR chemoreceptor srh domain-containing protein [Ditylenchus destructor]|nr:serpentine type 7TM GPCR chemoreceptor srh domain-containing protein [Ditylenchus destructor]
MDRDAVLPQPPDDYGIYVWFMRFNAFLATTITILVIYLILKCTPKAMKVYKWFLLNLSLCCYLLDIHITVIFTPLPLYPAMTGCAIGLISPLGYMAPVVSFLLMTQLLTITGVSILLALMFRLASVHGKAALFQRKFVIFVCIMFQFCFGIPILISSVWIVVLTEKESLDYMRKFGVPMCMILLSNVCNLSMSFFQHQVEPGRALFTTFFYVSLIFSTLHTFANGVIMIAFVKPYREACSDLFCLVFRRETSHLVLAQEPSTRSNLTVHRAKVTPKIVKPMYRPSSYPK